VSRLVALTRAVPDSLAGCELTHLTRTPIDVAIAKAQHDEYQRTLAFLGCNVRLITPAPHLADSVFVEDAAIVLDDVAIITRPGASSRRDETAAVADAVSHYRPLRMIAEPATLDGGDVLRLSRTLYVGLGGRTNEAGVAQLADAVRPFGYEVEAVPIDQCLHLKSAVTEAAPRLVLVNPAWVDPGTFVDHDIVEVDLGEPFAANVLRVGDTVLSAVAHERTGARLAAAGLAVRCIDVSELAKAEAGVTCCSLIFRE
jgi:dimethylargininase